MTDVHPDQPQAHLNAPTSDGFREDNVTAVRFTFSCEALADQCYVVGLDAREELNRPYELKIRLEARDDSVEVTEMLGRDALFRIERGEHVREFHGLISSVLVHDDGATAQTSTMTLVPAMATLGLGRATRIFQEQTALEIIETVLGEGLGPHRREFDVAIVNREPYLVRDYCVQYQESDLDFVHRLMEEEGIGYYFENRERECVVLFDHNRQLADVPTHDGGPVPFDYTNRAVTTSEPVVRFMPEQSLRPDGLTVSAITIGLELGRPCRRRSKPASRTGDAPCMSTAMAAASRSLRTMSSSRPWSARSSGPWSLILRRPRS